MGAWIEMRDTSRQALQLSVAPHVGAWIEIKVINKVPVQIPVAPHVGAWIEIIRTILSSYSADVAPHVGAWIEIGTAKRVFTPLQSHPTWVRGLKFFVNLLHAYG